MGLIVDNCYFWTHMQPGSDVLTGGFQRHLGSQSIDSRSPEISEDDLKELAKLVNDEQAFETYLVGIDTALASWWNALPNAVQTKCRIAMKRAILLG